MPTVTQVQQWLQSRTTGRLRKLGKYLLFQVTKGQRWRQQSRLPLHPKDRQGPGLTRHRQDTAEASCVSTPGRQETQQLYFDFLLSSTVSLLCPRRRGRQPWRSAGKRTLGYRENALQGCQDPRLADSLFWSFLCCLCSGGLWLDL